MGKTVLAAALLALFSCQGGVKDRLVATATDEDFKKAAVLEQRLLEYRLAPDPAVLIDIRTNAEALTRLDTLNKRFLAMAWGIVGEAAWLEKNTGLAETAARNMEKLDRENARYYIIRSRLEPVESNKVLILQKGLDQAGDRASIGLEMGLLLYGAGHYAEAVVWLEESLNRLPEIYARVYGKTKEDAYRMKGRPVVKTSGEWLKQDVLTAEGMLVITRDETAFLDFLAPDLKIPAAELLQLARVRNLLPPSMTNLSGAVGRKDAAFFLYRLMAARENNHDMLDAYTLKYTKDKGGYLWIESPVPDVEGNDPCFDAVLGVVERGVMDLTDGMNFSPARPVSPVEFLEALNRVKKLYP